MFFHFFRQKLAIKTHDSGSSQFGLMPRHAEMTVQEKWALVARYNSSIDEKTGKVHYGTVRSMANELNLSVRTIHRVVQEYQEKKGLEDSPIIDLTPQKKGHVGRKSELTPAKKRLLRRHNTLTKGRASLRNLAERTGIPKSSIDAYTKVIGFKKTSSWLKPKLTERHKMERLKFVLNLREGRRKKFKEQRNTIVVDESWFYLFDERVQVRYEPGKSWFVPSTVRHKSHIPKIMFLTDLARPNEDEGFDGKIGIHRVWKEKVALRRSVNHRRGDVYMADCNMDHDLFIDIMKEVIDEIKEKMPWLPGEPVFVQYDGASPHTSGGVEGILNHHGSTGGWNIKMVQQPAQSPDLNINDLSFFHSLKARVNSIKNGAETVDSLYESVLQAWDEYDSDTLKILWGHQYACDRCIINSELMIILTLILVLDRCLRIST